MYNRNDMIFGMIFIGIGIILFIVTLWVEAFVTSMDCSPWVFLMFRIIALICIVAGIVGIITSLTRKKKYSKSNKIKNELKPCQCSCHEDMFLRKKKEIIILTKVGRFLNNYQIFFFLYNIEGKTLMWCFCVFFLEAIL